MFTVLTELAPTRYWLVCEGCRYRWSLAPDVPLLPQTRRIMAEHQLCGGTEPEPEPGAVPADVPRRAPPG